MNALQALPPWAAALVGALVLAGALLACIGSFGLLRLDSFYRRVHAPTLGTTLGLFLVIVGTIAFFSLARHRAAVSVIVLGACVTLTTPITLMLLVRAALKREPAPTAMDVAAVENRAMRADESHPPGGPD